MELAPDQFGQGVQVKSDHPKSAAPTNDQSYVGSSNSTSDEGREPSRPVTAFDVAREAGVSQSTVSRAFSTSTHVSSATRERVLETASRLGYRPNAIARSLNTQKSRLIGIVLGDLANPFYGDVLAKLNQALYQRGVGSLVLTPRRDQPIDDLIPALLEYQVDGVVITSATLSSEMAAHCQRLGIPVVLFNRNVADQSIASVQCDNIAGGVLVADLFAAGGHTRPAFITGIQATSTNQDRFEGFARRLTELGVAEPAVARGDYTYEGGFNACIELLVRSDRPDFLFCANDITAMGALDAARSELGLSVPDDLSIIGFDDIPAASWPIYQLTTVRQRINRMIDATVSMLFEREAVQATTVRVPGNLMMRRTVRIRNTADSTNRITQKQPTIEG